jgi:hypothetical protein
MDEFSQLFTLLVRSFMSSSAINTAAIDKMYEEQRKWYSQLRASLGEAKYEYFLFGRKEEFLLMQRLVERMEVATTLNCLTCQGLGQHLGGLKSAAEAQSQLLQEIDTSWDDDECATMSTEQLWKIFINHLGPHMVLSPSSS